MLRCPQTYTHKIINNQIEVAAGLKKRVFAFNITGYSIQGQGAHVGPESGSQETPSLHKTTHALTYPCYCNHEQSILIMGYEMYKGLVTDQKAAAKKYGIVDLLAKACDMVVRFLLLL
jgi:hypothetical protein